MIVDPDFLDHWKVRMLVDELGDELAPLYLLRIWAHCHNRRSDRFQCPNEGLKAICRYAGEANTLAVALEKSGFISTTDDNKRTANGWRKRNASLFAAWNNGSKGGRPSKKTPGKSAPNAKKPTGYPRVSKGKPGANPSETDKRREDGTRDEKIGPEMIGDDSIKDEWVVPEQFSSPRVLKLLEEFAAMRKQKNVPIPSLSKYSRLLSRFDSEEHLAFALELCIAEEYQGLKPNYRPPQKASTARTHDPRGNLALLGNDVLEALGTSRPPSKPIERFRKPGEKLKTFAQQKLDNTMEVVNNWRPPLESGPKEIEPEEFDPQERLE